MLKPKNAMEVFRLLDKSNCRLCGEKTCLAFAGGVFTGRLKPELCPKLDPAVLPGAPPQDDTLGRGEEVRREHSLRALRERIPGIDLSDAAERTGGRYENGRLILKIMGKDFSVDREGNLYAEIHINPWVAAPVLEYILGGLGVPVMGEWVPFRELEGGAERYPLFQKRCEEPLKAVADRHTELFDDLVHLFGGTRVAPQFAADVSVVLHPLPKVPMMLCYWGPDDGLASNLHLFFDRSTNANLSIGAVFSLGSGFSTMIVKLAQTHGP